MKHIKVIIVAVCAFWRFGFLKAPTFEKKCPVKLKAANLYRNVFFYILPNLHVELIVTRYYWRQELSRIQKGLDIYVNNENIRSYTRKEKDIYKWY